MKTLKIAGETVVMQTFGGSTMMDFTIRVDETPVFPKPGEMEQIIRAKILELAAKIQAEDAAK